MNTLDNAPNLRHLAAALEVKKQGSINRAASQIHLTQSALTQAMKKLEVSLGFKLFDRASVGLFPTEPGVIYLDRVERAIEHLIAIEKHLQNQRSSKRTPIYRQLTTTQLRAFICVVEEESYTLAARRLGQTQPTVHRAVKEMEVICGQSFFRRAPNGVEPSWQARLIVRHINLFFSELNQGLEEVSEHGGILRGSLRVGSLPLARTEMIPKAVVQLLQEFPKAQVSIVDGPYEEQLNALLNGRIDMIVGALRTPLPSPDVVQEFLFKDPLHLVVRPNHPLATTGSTSAAELREFDWIAPRENTPAREAFTRFFTAHDLAPPERIVECSSLVAIRGILLASDRVALLPAQQVQLEVDLGLLALSPQTLPGTSREIGLTFRANYSPTKVQRRFIELIKNLNHLQTT